MDPRPKFIRNIRILPLNDLTHNIPKKTKVSQNGHNLVIPSAPPYKLSFPVLEKGDNLPTQGSIHFKKFFHVIKIRVCIEELYFNINGPLPQF